MPSSEIAGSWEDNGTPLQYSCLENPMDRGAWWAAVRGALRVRHDWATSLSLFTFMHWRGNGNPLQCSCLENPRDRGAWWAAVYGVAQSRTRLKQLSSSSSMATVFSFFFFKETSILFSTVAVSIYISTSSERRFPSSTPSPAFIAYGFSNDGHTDGVRWYLIVWFAFL